MRRVSASGWTGITHSIYYGSRPCSTMRSARISVGIGDFYIADREHIVLMRYDTSGRPLGAEQVGSDGQTVALLGAVRELMWHQAEPFAGWWGSHPPYHRSATGVAG